MSADPEILFKRRPGRPRKYETPEEFMDHAESYVAWCREQKEPVTQTGMALWMGFKSRQALHYYGAEIPGFADAVAYARCLVENAYERRLHAKEATGAIFALKNSGWSDRQTLEHSGPDGKPLKVEVVRRIVRPGDES